MPDEVLPIDIWIDKEIDDNAFNDVRITSRLKKILKQLTSNIGLA